MGSRAWPTRFVTGNLFPLTDFYVIVTGKEKAWRS